MTRAIGYVRVSTDLQREKGMGLEAQRETVRRYAADHGLELVDVVAEAASGGVRQGEEFSWEHRPALLELMDRAMAGEYDVLLVARFDRLSRDYATLTVLERRLRKHGARIVSATEENGDSALAEFFRGQLALIAQLERATIRDRFDQGKARRRRQGQHVEGSVPYGYVRGPGGTLEPDPERREIVARMFAAARKGVSPAGIARTLNHDGIASPRGKTWSRQAVTLILRNPAYYGELHGVRGAHEPIVSRRLWNEVQRALRARARST